MLPALAGVLGGGAAAGGTTAAVGGATAATTGAATGAGASALTKGLNIAQFADLASSLGGSGGGGSAGMAEQGIGIAAAGVNALNAVADTLSSMGGTGVERYSDL